MGGSILNERFILHEAGKTILGTALLSAGLERAKSLNSSCSIDVRQKDVEGLITALVAAEDRHISLYVMRDPSCPPVMTEGTGEIWLQTSGTTGKPKWIAHSFDRLTSKIAAGNGGRACWLLSFNAGSFAGMQVLLSALKGGHDLVTAPYDASVGDLARLAEMEKVTHISGTPTFWRAFLMASDKMLLSLKSITLGGEAADQSILDALRRRFPQAHLRHIYATTEAGVIFSVSDGRAGFPSNWLDEQINGIKLSLSDNQTLMVRNPNASDLARQRTWDTRDVMEIIGDRVVFKGRIDSMVNVGGVKVYPEEVEAFILQLPFVREVKVFSKTSPVTGQILTADMILSPIPPDARSALQAHLSALPRAHRPVSFRFVDQLELGATGKKSRVMTPADR